MSRGGSVTAVADDERRRILAEVARGGAELPHLVFTQNRRVMISVGGRGRVLRLHASFRDAPVEVLRAIGVLLAGPARARSAARELLAAFIRGVSAEPARRRARRIAPGDASHLRRLLVEFDRVNEEHFEGALPSVPIYLSGRMQRRNGHFCVDPLEIVVSRRLCEQAEDGEAEATLRHEMIHLWQHVTGAKPGHGLDFRRWARRLSVHPRALRQVAWRDGAA